jgi:hypothetical protein
VKKRNIIAVGIGSAFVALVWYDNFYATPLKPGKSAIGDYIIPKSTKEEAFQLEDELALQALRRREELQILFSSDNTRTNVEENIRTYPVPEVGARSLQPGRTLDMENIGERRPRTVYFKKRSTAEKEK